MSEFDRKYIINAITRMLARREHSVEEIVAKLSLKGIPDSDTRPVVAEFTDANIQSNARYAEAKVRSALSKGHGPVRVKRELEDHAIQHADIQAGFTEADIDFFDLARQVYLKKYGKDTPADFNERQKRMRFMSYRGFSHDQISYALNGE